VAQDGRVAYDEQLAQRIRDVVGDEPGIDEKKMFEGLAVLLDGNMAVGVSGEDLERWINVGMNFAGSLPPE
jgi:hypothetical protein